MLLIEPLLLFHMKQLLSEITSSSDLVISQLEAGPGPRPRHYAAQHQGGGAGGEVVRWAATGGADTQLISQVIKCTLHNGNVHNM